MRTELLDILAEPGTGARLRLEGAPAANGRVDEGRLVSEATGKAYPIVAGIPRFVAAENYAQSFGMQWNRFREVQIDSATGASFSRRRFDAEMGWTAEELGGKWILDAGCGAGRLAEIAAERGANLVALDYSNAVDAAAKVLAGYPNVDLVQASLLEPPFRQGVFDYAYCVGVVQHTPDPPAVIANVVALVRAGGQFSFTIYHRRPWTKLNAKYLLRPITRRLPPEMLLRGIEAAMPALFPLTDRLFRVPGLGRVAQFLIPVATYVDRDGLSDEQRYAEAVLDTFDMLSPRYDSPMTDGEVDAVLRAAGAARWDFRTRAPINVVGWR